MSDSQKPGANNSISQEDEAAFVAALQRSKENSVELTDDMLNGWLTPLIDEMEKRQPGTGKAFQLACSVKSDSPEKLILQTWAAARDMEIVGRVSEAIMKIAPDTHWEDIVNAVTKGVQAADQRMTDNLSRVYEPERADAIKSKLKELGQSTLG